MVVISKEMLEQCLSVSFTLGMTAIIMIYYIVRFLNDFFAWIKKKYRLKRYGTFVCKIMEEVYDFVEIGGMPEEHAKTVETALLYYDRKHKNINFYRKKNG